MMTQAFWADSLLFHQGVQMLSCCCYICTVVFILFYPVVPVYEGLRSFWIVLVFFCTVTLLVRLPGSKIGPCGNFCLRELSLITLLICGPGGVLSPTWCQDMGRAIDVQLLWSLGRRGQ